ncbi:MAG: hypothetical protein V8S34_01415 [Lawsonibacter sp.]
MDVRLPLFGSPVEERWRWSSPFLEQYPQFHVWMGKALFGAPLNFPRSEFGWSVWFFALGDAFSLAVGGAALLAS